MIKLRFNANKFLYFTAFSLYLMRVFLKSSLYNSKLPSNWARTVNIIVLAILIIKWVVSEKFTVRKVVIWAAVFFLTIYLSITNDYLNLFVVIALIFSAQDISFDDNLKCICWNTIVWVMFVVLSCWLGYLRDYTYIHRLGSLVRTAHSWGFSYYSTIGYAAMTISSAYLYFHRHCKYIHLFILAIFDFILYLFHTTMLSLVSSYIMIGAYIVIVKWGWIKFRKSIWDYIGTLLPAVLCLFTIGAVGLFANGQLVVNIPFLNTIAARLRYSVRAFREYGVHWFGTHVVMYGNTAVQYGDADSGFYIDSAYIYTIIAYGIAFTIVLILLYMLLYHYIYMRKDAFMYAWLAMILISCVVNNFILSLSFNPFLVLIPSILFDTSKIRAEATDDNAKRFRTEPVRSG